MAFLGEEGQTHLQEVVAYQVEEAEVEEVPASQVLVVQAEEGPLV